MPGGRQRRAGLPGGRRQALPEQELQAGREPRHRFGASLLGGGPAIGRQPPTRQLPDQLLRHPRAVRVVERSSVRAGSDPIRVRALGADPKVFLHDKGLASERRAFFPINQFARSTCAAAPQLLCCINGRTSSAGFWRLAWHVTESGEGSAECPCQTCSRVVCRYR